MGERYCEGIEVLELLDKEVVMGVAVTRSISHGKAYSEYSQKKDENGVITATFVGAKNMVGNTDLIFDNVQLDDMWMEMKEAGRDYVRKGKDHADFREISQRNRRICLYSSFILVPRQTNLCSLCHVNKRTRCLL